ncbi:MAG: CRTAC1 family protein [Acidobacteria bacterium]|nr:CRTAC1 family protein [Acidobacteriota bacterium]
MRAAIVLLLLAVACGRRAPTGRADLFVDATEQTGLRFRHFNGAAGRFHLPEIMGSGVALLDYDGDGDLDVLLVQGDFLDKREPVSKALFPLPAGHARGSRLFRNELVPAGRLRFTDITDSVGLRHSGAGMGVAAGDYDNDGDTDLYLTAAGPNTLFRNDGGRFTDVTRAARVQDQRWSTSAAFLDYDRDGDLDLFVANYVDFTLQNSKICSTAAGAPDYCTPKAFRPVPDRLFRNDGNGAFTDVTASAGIGLLAGPGLGVTCADFNGDGWPDIYVANDGEANHLWLNQRNGTFREAALASGVAFSEDGLPQAGMGVSAGDYDQDGDDDIVVTNLTREGSTLYRYEGTGFFSDVSARSGLRIPTFAFTGFGVDWFDYDNDGWLDLFVANGAVTMIESLRGQPFPFQQRNQLFRNQRGEFKDVTAAAGPALALMEVTRGAVFGDLDQDGDLDIVVSNNNGPARVFLNQRGPAASWLRVRLQGTASNRQGLGARVGLFRAGRPPLWRRVHTDSSYLSASEPVAHFGLDGADSLERIMVMWPTGKREQWAAPRPGATVTMREGSGRPAR